VSPSATGTGVTGLVIVDKAPGWTSHDVVAKLRGVLGQRRAGHAGTLDPDASGVLLVGLGRVTRLLRFLSALRKGYRGEVVLGTATDTLDASGTVVGSWEMSGVTLDQVRAAAASLTGDIQQVPPMVSALKHDGRRLHELARRGLEVERAPRPVSVYRFGVSEQSAPGVFPIDVECSAGTYVRSLADDLGKLLGGGAHLRALRRTSIGSFDESAARVVEKVGTGDVLPPAEAMRDLCRVVVDGEVARLIARGLALDRVSVGAEGEGPYALVDDAGRLLAVYEDTGTDRIRPAVVLAAH
jgi:tRNA pseudouridine55 synthase